MKNRQERMAEFVKYHIFGDGECNNVVLKECAARRNLNIQERYELSFLFSVTYCVESALILFEKQRKYGCLSRTQLIEVKPHLVFQSDRKYMRMKDSFERCMDDFYRNHREARAFFAKVCAGNVVKLKEAISYVSSWTMFGRFSAFLFLETLVELTGYEIRNTTIDWKNGDTATSGLLNLFCFDNYANIFDKKNKLILPPEKMDEMLSYTLGVISARGGNPNVTEVETSLCAYRKFYKGSRYNGYYLDRMLEEIIKMRPNYPAISAELVEIRKKKFDKHYLGEVCGWDGIRKDMKKLYLSTGVVS